MAVNATQPIGFELCGPTQQTCRFVSASIRGHRDTLIQMSFQEGAAAVRFWTADLTAEYVRLNADYHT